MSFCERLAEIARRAPEAIAIEEGSARLSYGELWARSGLVAARPVVFSEGGRGIDHVVKLVGAWRSGSAFVPLDPSMPAERRARIRRECEGGPSRAGVAYIIFTSGSTGLPKGVEVGHAGIVPLLDAQRALFEVDDSSRVFWMLSPAFDASISDIGVALLSGATIVCAPGALAPKKLLQILRDERITHVDLPPSILTVLAPQEAPASLRTIVIGGEVAPRDAVRRWAERVRVVGVYGPTEATVCTSMIVCDRAWDRPLLGRPLPHVTYEVHDGELWIAGPALALGYLQRPELEAEKFVHVNGTRFYRTGDRVKVGADGALEYLGRSDRQLKVRGQLVEPAEVERALGSTPGVERSAVVRHESGLLVAFIVGRSDTQAVRARLGRSLPSFMLPARVVALSSLPETTSGKIDLTALARIALPRHERSSLPATPEEETLARLWAMALERAEDEIGPEDDLGALGADSFAVLRFLVAAEAEGLVLSPGDVAQAKTVRDLVRGDRSSWCEVGALEAEVQCHLARIGSAPVPARDRRPRRVLLTGATGRIGRALADALRATELELTTFEGDLGRPRLGLEKDVWQNLAEEIDVVVHLGAHVSALASYETLRPTNVEGTAGILELARTSRPKRVVHASTLSIFVDADSCPPILRESDDGAGLRRLRGGYAQSKWVAEQLVRRSGVSGAIVRLGLVTGSEHAGELFVRVVRGLARLRAFPEALSLDASVDLTPASYVTRALVALVQDDASAPAETLHVAGPARVRLREVVDALARAGVAVERVPAVELVRRVSSSDDEDVRATDLAFKGSLFDERPFVFDQARAWARFGPSPAMDVDALVREALR